MEALGRWVTAAPRGRALDLGAGEGEIAIWLAANGYLVDAVESSGEKAKHLRTARRGLPVVVHELDLRTFPLAEGTYSLIVASAVLHFLRPSELWPLADRLVSALTEGGMLVAEVLTADDPEAAGLRGARTAEVEPNTYALGPAQVIHYFEAGELRRVFRALEILEYEEARRIVPGSEGYRSGALLIGRRPG
jgi:SAM-dependent methyltransferase